MGRLGLPGIGVFGGGRSGFGAGQNAFCMEHQLHSYVLPIVNFFKVF